MGWVALSYTLPLLIAGIIALILVVLAWRRRAVPGAVAFGVMMAAAAAWALVYAAEILAPDLATKVLLAKLEYPAIVLVPPTWLAFALYATDNMQWLTRRRTAVTAAIPVLTVLLVATNERHGLIWTSLGLEYEAGVAMLATEHGAAF